MSVKCGKDESDGSPFDGCGTMVFDGAGRLVYFRPQTKKLTKRNIVPFIKELAKWMKANK